MISSKKHFNWFSHFFKFFAEIFKFYKKIASNLNLKSFFLTKIRRFLVRRFKLFPPLPPPPNRQNDRYYHEGSRQKCVRGTNRLKNWFKRRTWANFFWEMKERKKKKETNDSMENDCDFLIAAECARSQQYKKKQMKYQFFCRCICLYFIKKKIKAFWFLEKSG